MADPGTAVSPFAVMFICLARYVPHLYIVDEIYEKDPKETISPKICPRIKQKCGLYTDSFHDWRLYYDVAAAWFKQHAANEKDEHGQPEPMYFSPVEKKQNDKESGIDMVNTLFENNYISISDRCVNTIWELDNYFKDKNGNFVKKNDNQIDNLRYFTKISRFVVYPRGDMSKSEPNLRRKALAPRKHSLDGIRKNDKLDWGKRILSKYYS